MIFSFSVKRKEDQEKILVLKEKLKKRGVSFSFYVEQLIKKDLERLKNES